MRVGLSALYVVPEAVRWDEEISKAFQECAPYHLHGLAPQIDGREVRVSGQPESPLEEAPETIIARVISELARGFRDLQSVTLAERDSTRTYAATDPFAQLLARGDIRPTSSGSFAYSGGFLAALHAVDHFLRRHASELGASEEAYPSTVPATLLERSGYLKSFPHHALFVAPVALRQSSIEVAQAPARSGPDGRGLHQGHLGEPTLVLAPTVCFHCFNIRQGQQLPPRQVVTANSLCHRFEGPSTRSLERLNTFRMREIIFFAPADDIQTQLDACFSWFCETLTAWDVAWQAATATDPFFGNSSDSKRIYQAVRGSKREVRLLMGHPQRWVAVASFNNHAASLTDAFAIAGAEGRLHSGCVGFGLERLLYGLFSAFGSEFSDWPDELGCQLPAAP